MEPATISQNAMSEHSRREQTLERIPKTARNNCEVPAGICCLSGSIVLGVAAAPG